jgi:flagellar biosynthesis anti-sigma factor FlgM
MQIDNSGINKITSGKTENIHHTSNAASVSKNNEESGQKDTASLSEEGLLLSKAYSNFSNEDSYIREELVSSIKQKIQEGSYTIPTEKLASALMKIIQS